MNFDWNELAFGSKSAVNQLKATFIAAPRELSVARFTQLVKEYLPKGNIVLGLAKEPYVLGLEDQPQFRMLQEATVKHIIAKVNNAKTPHKLYILTYFQRDLIHLLEKLHFKKVVLVNGSWYRAFHLRPEFYTLAKQGTPYELISPFASEQDAQDYPATLKLQALPKSGMFAESDLLALADQAATHSYAYSEFQTGVALGRKAGNTYKLLATAHNKVVPFETYAMHHGASREIHFSPANDLNHYDVLHAEMQLLAQALKSKIDLKGTTMFINLLPCPTCARMLSQTDITEFVYQQDHSDGYAVKMLELSGKKVRRLVP
nr:Cytidine and deoxycytidylate deaminase zinc-binding region [uncultured bacterium]AIA13941.1 Cytidine and deoxycytidylate deaminase zinc-binding region [uncultured bacterium]